MSITVEITCDGCGDITKIGSEEVYTRYRADRVGDLATGAMYFEIHAGNHLCWDCCEGVIDEN